MDLGSLLKGIDNFLVVAWSIIQFKGVRRLETSSVNQKAILVQVLTVGYSAPVF